MRKQTLFTLLLAVAIAPAIAQQKADTIWKAGFQDDKVRFSMITADGTPLVNSENGDLFAVDATTGRINWNARVGNADGIRYFPGTPYVEVNGYVINPANGVLLPLSSKAQTPDGKPIEVKKSYIFPQQNLILVYGDLKQGVIQGNVDQVFSAIDYYTGKARWVRNDMFKNTEVQEKPKKMGFGGLIKEAGRELVKDDVQKIKDGQNPGERFLSAPIPTKYGSILLPLNFGLHAITLEDGKLLWKKEYAVVKKGIVTVKTTNTTTQLSYSADSSIVYIDRSDLLEAVDVQSGKSIWVADKTAETQPAFLVQTEKGLLSLPSPEGGGSLQNKRITLYNPENGKVVWETKLKPGVKSYLRSQDIFFLSLENTNDKETVNGISLADGKLLYKDPIELKGNLLNLKSIGNYLFLLGDQEIQVADRTTGETTGKAISKDKEDQWLLVTRPDCMYIMISGAHKLYKFDYASGIVKQQEQVNIDFKGKENPTNMEWYENNLLIYSDQNILMLSGNDLKPIYQQYFKAPGKSVAGKIISGIKATGNMISSIANATVTAIGGLVTVAAATSDDVQQIATLYPEETNAIMSSIMVATFEQGKETASDVKEMSQNVREISRRFKASKKAQDYLYMLSFDTEEDLSILQVSKKTGQAVSSIALRKKDKSPNYMIDELGKRLYYIPRVTGLDETLSDFDRKRDLSKVLCLELK
jgi:outer membrane protein assembly factor BamB